MTVPRFVMDTNRLSISRPGVSVLTSAAVDNLFDSRLAGAFGILVQGQVSIPAVGVTTTQMLPQAIGSVGTCAAVFNLTAGIPPGLGGSPAPATTMFADGYWAPASGPLFGARAYWPGILVSAYKQYRWIFSLLSDRITITQQLEENGSASGTPFSGTVRYTVFQDNIL